MSVFDTTISRLPMSIRKNGHVLCILCKPATARERSGTASRSALTADPKPYHPGRSTRLCAQLKTHGIARRSSIAVDALRDAGRLPMFSWAISVSGVAARK
jgi:hypothetical protein